MHFSIRRGRRIKIAALMAQKRWPDNAVISRRRAVPHAADFATNPSKFHALGEYPVTSGEATRSGFVG